MPIYRLNCDCGLNNDQFLQQDHDTVLMPCVRCKRNKTWRQVRNSALSVKERNEVRGVFDESKNI